VAIVSRNYPEYISAFWGIQLLGGIAVMVNAWLPDVPLHHSVSLANSKVNSQQLHYFRSHRRQVIFADAERALIFDVERLRREVGTKGFIVFRPHEGKSRPRSDWIDCASAVDAYKGNPKEILDDDLNLSPEDNATIFFTSGT
jgi:acyl-CoA synthetase (AMP-forming)/AMP-acid ligase II